MKVGVVGAGYVGLVAAACFAESGNEVICVDVDEKKVARLNAGEVPIFEPGLDHLIENNKEDGRLVFSVDVADAVKKSEVIFIAVGTPQDEDGSADLKYVLQVAEKIGQNMNGHKIIVNKSTVPVGTADLVTAEVKKHTTFSFDVVSNPEFLKEGAAIEDFMKPDRVVIGASNQQAAKIMEELYSPFVRTGKPIMVMDVRSAELTKYASNAFLATKVTFMNEIANLCERVGADVNQVRKGVGSDNRIGPSFLFPGVGYGGSCFPKDVKALVRTAADAGYEIEIVKSVDKVNDKQKMRLVEKIIKHFGGADGVKGKRFAMWGLAFKPNTDDMREAPSLTIISELCKLGAVIQAYDPEAMEVAESVVSTNGWSVEFAKTNYQALEGADALLVVTEWNEFRRPDFAKIRNALNAPVVFDGRNIFEFEMMLREGFIYYPIGRRPVGI
jgi:UDPglucose 6-dehydrogenase